MTGKIIAAFPLCGKSYCTKNEEGCLDSDSSQFSWKEVNGERVRNDLFPLNYVIHILNAEKDEKVKRIFVSTHDAVLSLLDKMGAEYTLVHPANTPEAKEEWLRRFDNREFNGFPRNVLEDNWEKWQEDMKNHSASPNVNTVVLDNSQYLSDVLG